MLKTLAKFAFDNAPQLCDPEHGCTDYHRVWGIARLSRGAAEPAGASFFHESINEYETINKTPQILICGGADHGVAQMINEACMHAGVSPEILFVDRCATPVQLNDMYAQNEGIALWAKQGNLVDVEVPKMDIIVVHSFLSFLSLEERARIFKRWAQQLKDGGILLISNRIATRPDIIPMPPAQEQLQEQLQSIEKTGLELGLSKEEIQILTSATSRVWTRDLRHRTSVTRKEIDLLVEENGLELEHLEEHDRSKPGQIGPLARMFVDQATRAEIRIRK